MQIYTGRRRKKIDCTHAPYRLPRIQVGGREPPLFGRATRSDDVHTRSERASERASRRARRSHTYTSATRDTRGRRIHARLMPFAARVPRFPPATTFPPSLYRGCRGHATLIQRRREEKKRGRRGGERKRTREKKIESKKEKERV